MYSLTHISPDGWVCDAALFILSLQLFQLWLLGAFSWLLCPFYILVSYGLVFSPNFFTSCITRCSRLILYIPCLTHFVGGRYDKPRYYKPTFGLGMFITYNSGITNQHLGIRYILITARDVVSTSQLTEQGHMCIY